jgi:hypothetical protein
VEKLRQALERLLDSGNVEDVEYIRRLVDLLHHTQELAVDILESGRFNRQEVFNIGVSGKHTLKVNPLSLHINPDIEQYMYSVQLILPRTRLLLKLLVIRGVAHSL